MFLKSDLLCLHPKQSLHQLSWPLGQWVPSPGPGHDLYRWTQAETRLETENSNIALYLTNSWPVLG